MQSEHTMSSPPVPCDVRVILAVGQLASTIRRHLPIVGEPGGAPPQPWLMIHEADLKEFGGEATFTDLLTDLPGGEEAEDGCGICTPPDRIIRRNRPLVEIAEALREVHAALPPEGFDLLRGRLGWFGRQPLYWWRCMGGRPAERGRDGELVIGPDGNPRPSAFLPVQWDYHPIDGVLLDELRRAAEVVESRQRPTTAETEQNKAPSTTAHQYVTLDQAAAIVSRSRREGGDTKARTTSAEGVEWSRPQPVTVWAKVFGVCRNTMTKRLKEQVPRNESFGRHYRVALDDLPPGQRDKYRGV
jgi:hypothetical protein